MKRPIYGLFVVMMLVFHSAVPAAEKAIHSMGLPSRNEFYGGPMAVFDQTTRDTQFGGQLYAGWTRYLTSPLFGVGIGLEGYAEYVEEREFDGGGRLVGKITPIFLQAGVDYNIETENAALLEKINKEIEASDYQPAYLAEDATKRKPKLHMKINFFFSDEVKPLLAQPGWDEFWRGYIEYREKFMIQHDHYVDVKDVPESLRETFNEIAQRYRGALNYEERQKAMGYLTIGSQNHNYRSLIMDGEVVLVVANAASLNVLMDMFFLSGITTWIDDFETLENYLPAYKGWKRSFSRYIMKAL